MLGVVSTYWPIPETATISIKLDFPEARFWMAFSDRYCRWP
jgi:hypothetical protein